MMNEKYNNVSILLREVYDKVRNEVGFDQPLPSLITNRAQWRTDISGSLDKAIWYLLRADSNDLADDQRAEEKENAELVIRDLVAQLLIEQDEIYSDEPTSQIKRVAKWYFRRRQDDTDQFIQSAFVNDEDSALAPECLFTRKGTDIEVEVGRESETNFFSDVSRELHRCGLFIATYDILPIDTRVDVRLILPGQGCFQLEGTVSWTREAENCAGGVSPGMGIVFRSLRGEPGKAIQRYMSERPPLLFETG